MNPRHRRPHSRQGRTAETQELQRWRKSGWKPPTMWTPSILLYYRCAHRRLRSRHERRKDWWRKCAFERHDWNDEP